VWKSRLRLGLLLRKAVLGEEERRSEARSLKQRSSVWINLLQRHSKKKSGAAVWVVSAEGPA
jgi:hypothetical protein